MQIFCDSDQRFIIRTIFWMNGEKLALVLLITGIDGLCAINRQY